MTHLEQNAASELKLNKKNTKKNLNLKYHYLVLKQITL